MTEYNNRPGALENFVRLAPHRFIMKWSNYFDIYEELFGDQRMKDNVCFLEIGVARGGSLQMWRNYFGPLATIVGVDIEPNCLQFAEDRTHIRIGDQSDKIFLADVAKEFGPFDIILDDGGHQMSQQIQSFEALYHHVKPTGVYMVEDTHTSYWPSFGGGARREGTFIEYMKNKIDEVNGFHSIVADPDLMTDFTRSTFSIAFYDSIVAMRKRPRPQPDFLQIGEAQQDPT